MRATDTVHCSTAAQMFRKRIVPRSAKKRHAEGHVIFCGGDLDYGCFIKHTPQVDNHNVVLRLLSECKQRSRDMRDPFCAVETMQIYLPQDLRRKRFQTGCEGAGQVCIHPRKWWEIAWQRQQKRSFFWRQIGNVAAAVCTNNGWR